MGLVAFVEFPRTADTGVARLGIVGRCECTGVPGGVPWKPGVRRVVGRFGLVESFVRVPGNVGRPDGGLRAIHGDGGSAARVGL